jgi:opacity protein-like surface antigen
MKNIPMKNNISKILFFLAFGALAFGQSFEGSVSGGVSQIGNVNLGGGYSLDSGFRLALRMTLNTHEHFGYEFGYAYNRTHLDGAGLASQGMAIHQGFGDVLLYATPTESRIRPFLAGGLNFSNFVPPGQSAQYGQGATKFGVNYGAGVKFKVTGPWQIRFDVRQYNTGKPFGLGGSGRLLQNEISAGVSYTL